MRVRQAVRERAIAARASAWSTRPRSSPPPASWRATRSIYGGGGTLELEVARRRRARAGCGWSFEDQGPGIADIELALTDGYTTGGGLGLGLGGARRLSNEFEIDSAPGRGHARHASRAGGELERPRARRSPTRAQVGEARRGSDGARACSSASTTRDAGRVGARRHRGGHQPRQARQRRRAAAAAAARARRRPGIEMLALDRGPGMADVGERCCATASRRPAARAPGSARSRGMSTRFDVYTAAGRRARRCCARAAARARSRCATARASRSARCACRMPGETVCGDDWACAVRRRARARCCVADGLGHGDPAADAAARGGARLPGHAARCRAGGMLDAMHARAAHDARRRGRRRAHRPPSAGRCDLRRRRQHRRRDRGGRRGARSLVSQQRHRRARGPPQIQEFAYPWAAGDAAGHCTPTGSQRTGRSTRYPGLRSAHPALIAACSTATSPRGRDDATVVVARRAEPQRDACRIADASQLRCEHDVVLARQRARQIAGLLGFDAQDQTRIATAVSEIARNAFHYARRRPGRVRLDGATRAADASRRASPTTGPGIADLDAVLDGPLPLAAPAWASGIIGRAAADGPASTIDSRPGEGTDVVLAQARCPGARRRRSTPRRLARARGRAGAAARRAIRSRRCSSRTRSCCARSRSCAGAQEELAQAQPRARGHQPRRRRALRRARRAGRPPAPRRRDEVALPLEHEPRVPHAAELDPGARRGCCSSASTAS